MVTDWEYFYKAALNLGIAVMQSPDSVSLSEKTRDSFAIPHNAIWWWEHLPTSTVAMEFSNGNGYEFLGELIKESEHDFWFVVADEKKECFPFARVSGEDAQAILSHCYFFEYYLVDSECR
jgi:hypothetical protein